jgi:beta-glucosidase
VVVVLNVGGVIETSSWRDNVDAILLSWQPGLEAGNAVADVLSGKVNASGKLATTFPVKYEDEPSAKNFPGKEFPEKAEPGMFGMKQIPAEVTYEEGIYVGYRYYNTFNVKPSYEFGYGLSYTDFKYGDLSLSSKTFDKTITATITVTNTGKVAGKEVVQLYITAAKGKLDKPSAELKGFAKTGLLQPGQSEKITFTIDALTSFDTDATAWIADAGNYTVKVGSSSANIKQTSSFSLANAITVEKCNKVLVPQAPITELKK